MQEIKLQIKSSYNLRAKNNLICLTNFFNLHLIQPWDIKYVPHFRGLKFALRGITPWTQSSSRDYIPFAYERF